MVHPADKADPSYRPLHLQQSTSRLSTPSISPYLDSRSNSPPSTAYSYDDSPLKPTIHAQPVSHPARTRRGHWWTFELLCLITSLLAMIATAFVLNHFNEKPIPRWSWRTGGISLNSVLSLLSTLSRSSLMIPLDEALGQLMWLGFAEGEKRLVEAELFNQAARGPMGAAKLIWRRKGRGIASIGCLIMFLAVGLGTAQQQLLSYPTKLIITPTKSVQLAMSPRHYNSFNSLTADPNNPDPKPAMEFAVDSGMFRSLTHAGARQPSVGFVCNSGNCEYPEFTTLAVCAKCEDETDSIQSKCETDDYCVGSYPGTGMNAFSWMRDETFSTVLNQTAVKPNDDDDAALITTIKSLNVNITAQWPPKYTATSCALSWCLQRLNATVVNSTYSETTLPITSTSSTSSNGSLLLPNAASEPDIFSVSAETQQAFATLNTDLSGFTKVNGNNSWITSSVFFAGFANYGLRDPRDPSDDRDTLPNPIEALARGMSAAIRQALAVSGSTVEKTTVIRVRWFWLIYPAGMWVLSALFLGSTIVKSWRHRDVGAWGSSSLALMLWGADEETREFVGDWSAVEMEKRAQEVKVRLVTEGPGWRVRSVRRRGGV